MSAIEAPNRGRVWRAWDKDAKLVGQWAWRPAVGQRPEEGSLTLDLPSGIRSSWRVRDGHMIDPFELLESISNPRNPIFGD